MEYVLTVDEMRQADAKAMEELGIRGLILMENAGLKSAQCIANRFHPMDDKSVGIFCGKGNNGGDGFVIGRHLSRMGAMVTFWLTGKKEDLKGDAQVNMAIADNMGLPIHELSDWDGSIQLTEYDFLVDALLGTGLKGDVLGVYADIIKSMNDYPGEVVAVDTPSGLDCDSGETLGVCIKADLTVTMGNFKSGMLFSPGRDLLGELFIADLNVPDFVFEQINPRKYFLQLIDYHNMLGDRPSDAYKNTFGKILVFAGSTGLTGAACLSCLSAFHSGAGMVILGCPKSLNPIFETKLTEVMTEPLPETDRGSLSAEAFEAAEEVMNWSHVLALGPGLSTHPETKKFVHRVLTEQSRPMVIDADGLNNLAGHTDLIKQYGNELILTPHVGELSRLIESKIGEIKSNPIETVRCFAEEWGCVLLLKGAPTLVGDQDGNVYINRSGNAGMATAGAGDVLTGLIAGFLAQGLNARDATLLGAFVHGAAGDRAQSLLGQRSMIAGDIMDHVPEMLIDLENLDYENFFEYANQFGVRIY